MTEPLKLRQQDARQALAGLVPAYYRRLDAGHPAAVKDIGPLGVLLDLLADQSGIVGEDIARLYDEWFIETCSDWVVPYIGALVRARTLPSATPDGQRLFVANTIAYRSRKGTVGVIEQLAPRHLQELVELGDPVVHRHRLALECLQLGVLDVEADDAVQNL